MDFAGRRTQHAERPTLHGRLTYLQFAGDRIAAVSVYLEPSVIQYWFDGTSFGQVRNDTYVTASLTTTKRDWDVLGFAPTFTVAYQRNMSTVDVFSYDRELFQLGFTRRF